MFAFITKVRKGKKTTARLLAEGSLVFRMFVASQIAVEQALKEIPGGYSQSADKPAGETSGIILSSAGFPSGSLSDTGGKGRSNLRYVVKAMRDPEAQGVSMVSALKAPSEGIAGARDWASTQVNVRGKSTTRTDRFVNLALLYLFRKATEELKAFHSKKNLDKIAVEVEGIMLSKGRILHTMDFLETAELDLDMESLGIRRDLPVLDRYSPLSYAIAQHVHWNMAKHRGVETCTRMSLQEVHIIQGPSLYKELGQNCPRCAMKRQRYLKAAFGPINEAQLTLAPPFFFAQMDLFGPVKVYVPGKERETRLGKPAADSKCWVVVFVCPTTRLINMQVVERHLAEAIISAVTRLGCEMGVPKKIFIDQDGSVESGLTNVEFDLLEVQGRLERQFGIEYEVCPVSGHNQHGHVERVIRSVQESFKDSGLLTGRYTATSLQTLAKVIENTYNNLPLGYHHHDDSGGNSVLKMITPNHLRMGRLNTRTLEGPMRLPANVRGQLEAITKMYKAWFNIWAQTYVPRLIHQPKWFQTDEDLMVGDVVYFQRRDQAVGEPKWTLGIVEELEKGKDGIARKATVKYCNSSEQRLSLVKNKKNADKTLARYTERAVRKLIKLFSVEELSLTEDLARLDKLYGTGQHPLYTGGQGRNMFAQVAQVKNNACNCREHNDVRGEYELVVEEEQAMQVGEVLVNPHQEEKNLTNDVLSVDELSTNTMVEQFLRA